MIQAYLPFVLSKQEVKKFLKSPERILEKVMFGLTYDTGLRIDELVNLYTHRTAISNNRIIKVGDKNVSFTWKNYRDNYTTRTTTLPGNDFLRLFCQHILPPGFTRIRHYGFLSSASKRKSLAIIRASLNVAHAPTPTKKTWQEIAFERMGISPGVCKCCGGKMVVVQSFPNQFHIRQRAPPVMLGNEWLNYHMIA